MAATALTAGTINKPSGCGVIFEVKTNGKEIILYNFLGGGDGQGPGGLNLIKESLYGAAGFGPGLVFEFTK